MSNKNLIPLQEIEQEIRNLGVEVSYEYPGYLQVGEYAFGHSLGYEDEYDWNNDFISGSIPKLPTAREVAVELIKQIGKVRV
jgi:replication-associated recombination protein RarA